MGKILKASRLGNGFEPGLHILLMMFVVSIAIVSILSTTYLISTSQKDTTAQNSVIQVSKSLHISHSIAIYIYDLPRRFNKDWLQDNRCGRHLFGAEVALHSILSDSIVRTLDAQSADFFLVPVYVSCNFSAKSGFPQLGRAAQQLHAAIHLVARQLPYWKRKGGRDHIFIATHDFGACFHAAESAAVAVGIPRFMTNSIILQTFGYQGSHPCQHPKNSILIPPYVSVKTPNQSVVDVNRTIWAYFRGKMEIHPRSTNGGGIYSKGVRTILWQKFGHDKRFFIQRKRLADYQSEMLRSKFCICPLGWAPWSPRIVEAVVLGCVPVIIADHIALPFAHVLDWPNISLRVPEKDVHKLDGILDHITATNLTRIQRLLWKPENRQALLYNEPPIHGDASWQILNVLSRLKQTDKQHGIGLVKQHALPT